MSKAFAVLITTLLFVSCSVDDNETGQDSFASYRYFLWRSLVEDQYEVDFIGTEKDPYRYPDYNGQRFDNDHEGIGGIRSDEVLEALPGTLDTVDRPDVVLIGIGINDILQGVATPTILNHLAQIIAMLQSYNPNITIIIERVAGLGPSLNTVQRQQGIERYNDGITELSHTLNTSLSRVVVVDIYGDFMNQYFTDDLHYNLRGSYYVATQYYQAIKTHVSSSDRIKILPLGDSRVVGYRSAADKRSLPAVFIGSETGRN